MAAKILNIPIYLTTQNAARLGPTVSELTSLLPDKDNIPSSPADMSKTSPPTILHDKTKFSMLTPTIESAVLRQTTPSPSQSASVAPTTLSVIIVGIESHICVTQTTLDLLAMGHRVYVLADGVSSCNAGERPVALRRLASEGATVTSSESVLFELMNDAKSQHFKGISGVVKETKDATREAVETFCD